MDAGSVAGGDEHDEVGVEDRRWPRRVYGAGSEPDPRFSLANERTLLAWLRTSLGLVVAGIAVIALAELVEPLWLVDLVAAVAFGAGAATALTGWRQWARAEQAMRRGEPLPSAIGAVVVLAGVLLLALLGVLGLLIAGR
ncbi:YidH family protein [Egicoccus sp. AB-alg6-2]|uniref:YidH family protein n=1 Tax=Egicoccus sp. AB-alg6-2 TaxID=3242692 RepID=UPI00359EC181